MRIPYGRTGEDVTKAQVIAMRLRQVPPHEATAEDFAACEQALALITDERGSELWCDLQLRWGHLLLERREGNHAENVARARATYTDLLTVSQSESAVWDAAVIGYANCLAMNPGVESDPLVYAFEMIERLVTRHRGAGPSDTLAHALGCYSQLVSTAPVGDQDANIEHAIALQMEQIEVLGSLSSSDASRFGRAQHNLAGLYLKRRVGLRTQNVDRAVTALQKALVVRTRESDPAGRARTLRGLALALREWSGAESQAHANTLAMAFQQEADEIAQEEPGAAIRTGEWGHFSGQQSALYADLNEIVRLPVGSVLASLDAAILKHRSTLSGIDIKRMPNEWANWRAGLGYLLAKRYHFSRERRDIEQSCECFVSALTAIDPSSNPRLYRDISRTMGDMCHQIALWEGSLRANGDALALSEQLLDDAVTSEERQKKLADMRGIALFACYAAVRLGQYEEAARLAEAGRARGSVDLMVASEMLTASLPPESRDEVRNALQRVRTLEEDIRGLRAKNPERVMADMAGRLADHFGVDAGAIKVRLTKGSAQVQEFINLELQKVADLRKARVWLRETTARVRSENLVSLPDRLQSSDLAALAKRFGQPIVYVLATAWGGAALIVHSSGAMTGILLEDITSDVVTGLLEDGMLDGAMGHDHCALAARLPTALSVLRDTVVEPITERLREYGYAQATLIPLGRLGLLPLHAAATGRGPAFAYAPSARALAHSLSLTANRPARGYVFCGVADPTMSLPFARAEVQGAVNEPGRWTRTTVFVGKCATKRAVAEAAHVSTHLHFACHGLFRPSEPEASGLVLADGILTLGELLRGHIHFSAAELMVLSACQTANPEFREVPDEVLGLPLGLMLAGVPRIACTMWRVDDRVASLFSQQLYQELFVNRRSGAAAVDAAQRWLREATVGTLKGTVSSLRRALGNHDDESEMMLSNLWRDLLTREPTDTPFASPEHWAAFAYVGI